MHLLSVLFRLPVLHRAEGMRAKSSEFNMYHLGIVTLCIVCNISYSPSVTFNQQHLYHRVFANAKLYNTGSTSVWALD